MQLHSTTARYYFRMLATNFWKKDLGTRLYLSVIATSEKGLEVSSPGTEMLLQAAAHKEGVPLPGIPSHCILQYKIQLFIYSLAHQILSLHFSLTVFSPSMSLSLETYDNHG